MPVSSTFQILYAVIKVRLVLYDVPVISGYFTQRFEVYWSCSVMNQCFWCSHWCLGTFSCSMLASGYLRPPMMIVPRYLVLYTEVWGLLVWFSNYSVLLMYSPVFGYLWLLCTRITVLLILRSDVSVLLICMLVFGYLWLQCCNLPFVFPRWCFSDLGIDFHAWVCLVRITIPIASVQFTHWLDNLHAFEREVDNLRNIWWLRYL